MSEQIRPPYTARAAFPRQPEQTVAEVKRLAGAERARLNEQIKKLLEQRKETRAAGEALAKVANFIAHPDVFRSHRLEQEEARAALAEWKALK